MTLAETFDTYAHKLDEKAAQTRQVVQLFKAGGLSATALGLLGLFGTGLGAIPAAIGLVAYGAAIGKEAGTTGRLMPLPWSQEAGAKMAAGIIQEAYDQAEVALTEFDYLSQEDKADYTLFGIMAPVILPMLEGANEVQCERYLTQARRVLVKYHADMIKDPELLAPHLFGSISGARSAFAANLPDELQAMVDPKLLAEAKPSKAAPVAPVETYIDVTPEVEPAIDISTHDLPKVLSGTMRSSLILGAPRAGKGYAVAKSLTLLGEHVDLWLIDPKNDPNESHYWLKVPTEQKCRFDVTTMDRATTTKVVMDLFQRFLVAPSSSDRPKLLIIDECSPGLRVGMVKAAYDDMLGRVATIASVGPSLGKFVWIISQATTTDDVGLSKANRASLRIAAVANIPKTEVSWLESVRDTMRAPMPDPSFKGYIQMLSGHWLPATPFELPPAPKRDDTRPAPAPVVPTVPTVPTAPPVPSDRDLLDAMIRPDLDDTETEVFDISRARGFIGASEVKQYASRTGDLRNWSPDMIRKVFDSLVSKGFGTIEGEGNRAKWSV